MFDSASMIPGGGTALNMQWLLPAASGLSPTMQRMVANTQSGDPGTIYDQMRMNKAVGQLSQLSDGKVDSIFGSTGTGSSGSGSSSYGAGNQIKTAYQLGNKKLATGLTNTSNLQKTASAAGGGSGQQPMNADDFRKSLGVGADAPINLLRQDIKSKNPQADAMFPEMFRAAIPQQYYVNAGYLTPAVNTWRKEDMGSANGKGNQIGMAYYNPLQNQGQNWSANYNPR